MTRARSPDAPDGRAPATSRGPRADPAARPPGAAPNGAAEPSGKIAEPRVATVNPAGAETSEQSDADAADPAAADAADAPDAGAGDLDLGRDLPEVPEPGRAPEERERDRECVKRA